MPNYYAPIQQPEIRNALLDFAPVNNALSQVRDQNNQNRNALLQREQIDMRKEEQTYQRGRDAKNDAWQQVQRAGQMADAIARMPDTDPAKASAWQSYLKNWGDGNHGPEELDFRTGPKIAAAAAGKFYDQRDDRMKDLELQKTQAEIGKLTREASGVGAKYGKTGAIVQGADGRYYSVQFAEDGTKKIDPLAVGETALTPSRGVSEVDTGTGTQIIDKATGLPVRSVSKDLAGAERDKIVGRETGERQMAFPKAEASLASANAKTQLVRSKIAQALPMVNNWTAGPGSLLSALPGTQARDLKENIDTIIANLGFEELQDMRNNSPTGGALGAIAVQELAMLQKTKTSLEQAQTVGQLQAALRQLDEIQAGAADRRQKAFASTYSPQFPQNVQPETQTQGGVAAPQSAEEYGRLPSGTRYRDPEGNVRIKP